MKAASPDPLARLEALVSEQSAREMDLAKARARTLTAARDAVEAGVTKSRVAVALGVSHQRVSQMIRPEEEVVADA